MKILDLFSGIGGFSLAFHRAGAETLTFCEINPRARAILRRQFPGVEIIEDVKTITKESIRQRPDIIVGGFPCQDLSIAGKRRGLDGDRSGLWFEYLRIIREFTPRWVVIENVDGLLSSAGGRDFAVILQGLVKCGYGVAWRVFDAQYAGLAQRRNRVFIVAGLTSAGCNPAEILFEREGCRWDTPTRSETGEGITGTLAARTSAGGGLGTDFDVAGGLQVTGAVSSKRAKGTGGPAGDEAYNLVAATVTAEYGNNYGTNGGFRSVPVNLIAATFDEENITSKANRTRCEPGLPVGTLHTAPMAVAFTERARADGRNFETQKELAYALTNPGSGGRTHSRGVADRAGVRRLTPVECERLQGFPDDWTAEGIDDKGRVIQMSDSARYRAIGNAIAVPCVEWIARRIVAEDAKR